MRVMTWRALSISPWLKVAPSKWLSNLRIESFLVGRTRGMTWHDVTWYDVV